MTEEKNKEINMLENLLLSDDLIELNYSTSEFNIFNALKLQNNEIRHSNFLSWLLAPYETHKLKDYFTKEFLIEAIRQYSQNDKIELSLSDIVFNTFEDLEVKREYKNIDLLLSSYTNKIVCVIENKIWTGEHDCQLERYSDIIEKEFQNYKKLYIYLSPTNNCGNELLSRSYDKTNNEVYYIPMNYEQVHDVIQKTLHFKSDIMNEEVKTFLNHYNKMIERDILGIMDEKTINLCKSIYKNHKEAIDLIVNINSQENENIKKEVFAILKDVINERKDIDKENTIIEDSSIICLPVGIKDVEKLKFGDWKPNDIILYIHFMAFKSRTDRLCVEFSIGKIKEETDKNKQKRSKFIDYLKDKLNLSRFNDNKNNSWAYTTPDTILTIDEARNCRDYSDLKSLIQERIEKLKEKYTDGLKNAINSAIDENII